MYRTKIVVLLFLVQSIWAANLRDLAKKIYVGTALDHLSLNDSRVYTMTGQQFNMLTPQYEMKWGTNEPVQGHENFEGADKIVAYAHAKNMKLRGHNLIWYVVYPPWVNTLNKTALHATMLRRVKNTVARYKGKLYAWDVLNEIIDWDGGLRKDSIWTKNFGESYIIECLKLARQTDPSVKLYINDFYIEDVSTKSTGLYNLVKKLKAQGVPIDGIGFQGHYGVGHIIKNMEPNLKRFADLGVEFAFTEVSISLNPPATPAQLQQQAKDYADIFKICENFAPHCKGVTVWGWNDKYAEDKKTECMMWDSNLKPKPAVAAVEAVLK